MVCRPGLHLDLALSDFNFDCNRLLESNALRVGQENVDQQELAIMHTNAPGQALATNPASDTRTDSYSFSYI